MGRRRKRSVAEEREWLSLYEDGKQVREIAQQAGRPSTTVWRGIRSARDQREQQSIRDGLLRTAYEDHQKDLRNHARRLAELAGIPDAKGLMHHPDRRARLLGEALMAHIPSSPLWQAKTSWEEAAQELESVHADLDALLERKVCQIFPEIDRTLSSNTLWQWVQALADGNRQVGTPVQVDRRPEGMCLMWGGSHTISQRLTDEERFARLQENYTQFVARLGGSDSPLLARTREAKKRWESAKDRIEEEIEVLDLRQVLPGRCRLCPGAEDGGVKRSRSKRRTT